MQSRLKALDSYFHNPVKNVNALENFRAFVTLTYELSCRSVED